MSEEKKVVLITGASSGIGNTCAAYLAKRGCLVFGTSRNPAQAKKKADEFFQLIQMDVCDEKSVKAGIDSILAQTGRIDLLICNAGMGISGPVETTPTESAELQLRTNFFGSFFAIREVLPTMRRLGGKVIVMSSIAGRMGIPFQAFYSASKFALEGFVESLRMELKPYPVQLCLVEPGDFRTGFTAARKKNPMVETDPYLDAGTRSVGVMEHDEANGANPVLIARLVYRMLVSKRAFRLRYTVGMAAQRFSVVLKRILPDRLFESMLSSYYQVNKKAKPADKGKR